MKKIIYIFIVVIVALYSCSDPYADNSFIKDESALPAASYMEQADSLKVSMWVDLLKYTSMFNTMNLSADYTCFVPDDAAMKAYLTAKGVTRISDLNIDEAKLLVKYHTIKGKMYNSISFENGVLPDSTASGDYLTSIFNETDGDIYINSEASIKRTVSTPNAYIHVLSRVLTPVTETIWGKINNVKYSIFREAMMQTGYDTVLNKITEVINGVRYKHKYTLFAVSDSVFHANNIGSFSVLLDSLKATTAPEKLYAYVGYHILGQTASYATLSTFSTDDKTTNYNTLAESQLLNVSEINRKLYFNYNSTTQTGVQMLASNVSCKNGVLHVIDGVLPVKSQKATAVTWEFTDYSVLASVLSKYRTAGLTSDYITALYDTEVFNCYTWSTVPEGRVGLFYMISNKNSAEPYKAVNYDYLMLSLGNYGWVEMTTGTIAAGKYSVTLGHFNKSAIAPGSKIMFIVDGQYFGSQIATVGASSSKDQYLNTSLGTIEFSSSAKHKVRILATDNNTSILDCLKFTPL